MSTKFINILGNRIIITSIKRYKPIDELKIAVYFSASRQKVDNEIFEFSTESERNNMLNNLDIIFDCWNKKTKRVK